jgi:RNA polymerase sigma-70 factor (ECF subfamily)
VNLEEVAARDSGPHKRAEKQEALRVLCEMLDQLDDAKREVFVLADIELLTAPQIGEALGINVTTVYTRLRDARRELGTLAQRHRARDEWRLR